MARITCFPPLGQSTVIGREQDLIQFKVLLETDYGRASQDCQVCIWHNHKDTNAWSSLDLQATTEFHDTHWFVGTLHGRTKDVVSFTLRYRHHPADPDWHWIRDETSVNDGLIHFQASNPSSDLGTYLPRPDNDIQVKRETADTLDTFLFSLTASVNAADGVHPGISSFGLGPVADGVRWFALVQKRCPWLEPRQGHHDIRLDADALLVSFLRQDGLHVACLAVNGVRNVTTTFVSDETAGTLVMKMCNDAEITDHGQVLVAVAFSLDVAVAAVMYRARSIIEAMTQVPTSPVESVIEHLGNDMKSKWVQNWYDGLSYCTWDSLGQDFTETKLLHALETLASHGISIQNLIIDDHWQSVTPGETRDDQTWLRFEANTKACPRGLRSTIAKVRQNHPNIKHIAIWHAMLGYWGGIATEGEIFKQYKTRQVTRSRWAEGDLIVVEGSEAKNMYDDFYRFLSESGVDAVKTDVQFLSEFVDQADARRSLIKAYLDAWTLAHLRHFGGKAIGCMSQSPFNIFYSQLPRNKPVLMVRNSGDFFPDIAKAHPWHVFCNANNAIMTQHLNVLADWDMFQTNHEWGAFHGAARAVSGGPIYFTDVPGQHDLELLSALSAKTPSGATVILRPDRAGTSTNPYTQYNEQGLIKISTYVGHAQSGTGIVGVFNCHPSPWSELVHLDEFPGTEKGSYVVRSFSDGRVTKPMARGQAGAFVVPRLEVKAWTILSAHPVQYFELDSRPVGIAIMGLIDKLTGSAAILDYETKVESNGRLRIETTLKALGVFGVYVTDLPGWSIDDDVMVMLFGKPVERSCVRICAACDQILEIDLIKAWDKRGQEGGWSNEVSCQVFVA